MKTDPVHQSTLRRFVARSLRYAGLSWLLVLSCLFMGERVLAQTPRSFLIPRPESLVPDQGQVVDGSLGEEPALRGAQAPLKLIVDTDAGVDDAAAIAWLLTQTRYPVEIVGFAAVAGNTTVENVANNLLLLKEKTGQTDIPVTIGSATPLTVTLSSTGKLIHGPDGLWGFGIVQFTAYRTGLLRLRRSQRSDRLLLRCLGQAEYHHPGSGSADRSGARHC